MAQLKDILILIFRFLATMIGVMMNVGRISSTKSNAVDDIMFTLSIIIGFIFGIYWDNISNYLLK